ncbi:M15 family metallopeptidase [Oenococcus oeni]|uniref:M15 family metallopeptidase n=1 Tax=Oenococcus oeni TaxID=1247 RepID=UPI0010BB2A67|nr:M15 family metallopeptidase [Oenococcus oeni]SYW17285.1 putative D-alanyl-D-alanine dipeptidase [Oenococcus oeni]
MKDFKKKSIKTTPSVWEWNKIGKVSIQESNDPLVSVSYIPEKLIVSPQYFIQNIPGALPDLYIRNQVQHKLIEAAKLLPNGYKFVIFDGWRSIETQKALFYKMKDFVKRDHPNFTEEETLTATLRIVALPSTDIEKPSPHNTGGSIDLSIADNSGRLLGMGGPFDDIKETAKTAFYENESKMNIKEAVHVQENRRFLYNVMTQVGFTNYIEEWWHFDYGNQNWAYNKGTEHAIFGATKPLFPWV